jgi:hypothetical protein
LSVGTTAVGAGELRATGEVTAFYSDERLKNILGPIDDALNKVIQLEGVYFEPNEKALGLGYEMKRHVGVSAQRTQNIIPEIVTTAPIDQNYLTVKYEKLSPLLIEAIKELNARVDNIEKKIDSLVNRNA